ncbi:hypothetical protein PPYR_09279 [Photinus pyralis]|uniref:Phosphatidylinositol-glycan biosynthesis class W protein n=1 Tax=Photinus pyralis TaxID=7054 RepID=A0A1Y1KUU8_PHOPY|nr:uncharacterized protein At4g17910-like [Photinus pyralis]XP_031344853.1 uncharacterized protein At4g17910-like [Photinus pyralis]KAB0798286.1 hypothetical protein PPYR_09279 [Photinus pyralis]
MKTEDLMHSNGTTAYETYSVIVPYGFLTFITSLLNVKYPNRSILHRLIFEFNLLIITEILIMTVLADYATEIVMLLIILCILLLGMFRWKDGNPPKPARHLNYITAVRSAINILSVIAILAVDFTIFPRRFAKTKEYGYSLMDVGVGLFVFSNGIVAPEIRGKSNSLSKTVRGTIPLIVLGSARFLATTRLDYNVPVSEYGVHWNFFITLAVVKLCSAIILSVVSVRRSLFLGASLLFVHEIILQLGVGQFVLSTASRSTFFNANREGISSSLGYLGLYFLSVSFGQFLHLYVYNKSRKHIFKLCLISAFLLWATVLLNKNFGISRRLANSGYCLWILFIGISMVTIFYLGEIILNFVCGRANSPLVFEAVNYNGLSFFLLANLLTGAVNILFDTLSTDGLRSLCIIIVYMIINCGVSYGLFAKSIKIKL